MTKILSTIRSISKKTFERRTFPSNYARKTKLTIGSQTKFANVVLAMMATKRLYSKDRLQFRKNRLGDKGGVVDFAWKNFEKKAKYHIKKGKVKGTRPCYINYNDREWAAKIVQNWWRERKLRYKKILDRIIKIQSVYRAKFVRKYMYNLFYLNFLLIKFVTTIEKTLVNYIRPKVFDELFPRKKLLK